MHPVLQDLLHLGDSAHQISESLLDLEVKGIRGTCIGDPIFEYLKDSNPEYEILEVTSGISPHCGHATIYDLEIDKTISIILPPQVSIFIRNFENGHYPWLEKEKL